jgi:hypothetical protein
MGGKDERADTAHRPTPREPIDGIRTDSRTRASRDVACSRLELTLTSIASIGVSYREAELRDRERV